MILHGDCLTQLKVLDPNSVDSLVTDPPAGISFMGKDWDADKGGRQEWIAWMESVMRECMRVMKPGAHGLVWALPRTSHWTAMALEDAGFEIRDCVYHLFGQGFPKSLDISKAIDKAAGAEREVVGKYASPEGTTGLSSKDDGYGFGMGDMEKRLITAPATDDAKKWVGWGTALKPAVECWWLVRKPCSEKTVAKNVQKWGTGALNIDGSRIEGVKGVPASLSSAGVHGFGTGGDMSRKAIQNGRFPSHLILSHTPHCTDDQCDIECAIKALDGQSGTLKSGAGNKNARNKSEGVTLFKGIGKGNGFGIGGDSGGASRFFYCAKISSSERNAGLEGMPDKQVATSNGAKAALARGEEYAHSSSGFEKIKTTKNTHPTVKPQKLMRYLINMVTPPGGTVLDPFTGSGSTGVAAKALGFKFVGIEREAEYVAIAEKRIEACTA